MANFIHFENSHVFSKAPVQENMPASESVNKSVHTVQAEEIWANKCPFITYNEVKDLTADKTFDSFEGYAPVKFNYKKQVIVLTDINNNGKDSNGLAGKVFIEDKPINQFISETDATDKNGALAFGYRPILFDKDGGAVPSDNYTVNCSNGIIYFTNPVTSTAENCNYFLSFFTYEGAKLDTTITDIKSNINETKGDLSSHADDTDIHIIADERSKWNTAASKAGTAIQTVKRTNNSSTLINVDQSETSVSITLSDTIATKDELSLHTSDTDIHITADERTKWNNHTIYNEVNSNNWNIIQDGSSAFTTSLEDLPSSMPSLTVATGMFEGNTAITEFNIKVPNLVIADNMFSGCTNLTTIDSSFQNVVSATNIFEGCPLTSIKLTQPGFANLTEAATYTTDETTNETTKEKGLFDSAKKTLVTLKASMPSLTKGTQLFKDFTALESYNGNLNQLEDGNAMFRGCSSMTSFSGDLSSLSDGRSMFRNSSLSSWDNDMPKLKDGYAMFFNCSNLTNFTGDIPLLENGVYMFGQTSNLISFTGSLESLVDGHQMFYGNGTSPSDTEKFTFTSNLSKLQNGHRMFYNNKRLGSFNIVEGSNLDSLLFSKHMFTGTSLTEFRYNLPNVGSYETYFDPNEKTDENPEGTTFQKSSAATAMFQNCTSLKTVVSDLSSITNGSMLFFGCTNLQTVDCDFSSMTEHGNMFSGCTSLTSFTANLSSLPDGQCQSLLNMFRGDTFTKIQHISGDMPNLRIGNHCMKYKTSLASFDVNLPSLFDASEMFYDCTNLTTFNSESGLPELVSGHNMFNGCTSLTSFSGDLPKMTNGTEMFASTKIAKFVEVDLSSLKVAPRMFSNNKTLTTFACDLPALTNSIEDNEAAGISNWKPGDAAYPKNGFFNHCESLESFSGNLSSLVSGYKMFVNCYKLGSFDAGTDGLKSLECGALMFMNCGNNVTDEEKKFTSFSADLSALKDGYGMFWGIDSLTSFYAGEEGLKSLERGVNMFSNCRLDADSIEHILTTIPDYEGTPILPAGQLPANENEGKGHLLICMQQSAAETFVRIYTEHEGITPTINANGEYNVDGASWMDFRGWKIGAMIIN